MINDMLSGFVSIEHIAIECLLLIGECHHFDSTNKQESRFKLTQN